MPQTHTILSYSFDELSEKAKQKAIENLYSINVDFDWWDCTYEDAKQIGLKITSFDTGRSNFIKGELTHWPEFTVLAIKENHGETCETYAIARKFETDCAALVMTLEDGQELSDLDAYHSLVGELERSLLSEYLCMLRNDYEHLTTEDAIIDTIKANGYQFTEDGKLF